MLRLLQIEFHKLRYNRAIKILIGVYFLLFFGLVFFSAIRFKIGDIDFQLADQGIFNFPYIWHFATYFAAILKIFLGLVVISTMVTEYSNETIKQNLIDGLSKKEFLLSKLYMILVFSVVSTILIFVVGLLLGLIFSDYNEMGIIFSRMEYIGGYFVKLIAFFSFCLFLGVWVKRTGFAIGVLFIWTIVENILKGIFSWKYDQSKVAEFLPLESMSNLIREPLSKLGIVKTSTGIIRDTHLYLYQILIALAWVCIFIWLSYRLLKKRDL